MKSKVIPLPTDLGYTDFLVISRDRPAPDGHVPFQLRLTDGSQTWRVYRKPDVAAGWQVGDVIFVQCVDKAGTMFNWGAWGCSISYQISPV